MLSAMRFFGLIALVLCSCVNSASGLITSDGEGTHVFDGGIVTPAFMGPEGALPAGFDPDSIVRIEYAVGFDIDSVVATGILLPGRTAVLTAAHPFFQAEARENGVQSIKLFWDLDEPNPVMPQFPIRQYSDSVGVGAFTHHPDFDSSGGGFGAFSGYDVAVITLDPTPNYVPTTSVVTEAQLAAVGADPKALIGGYGIGGEGDSGSTLAAQESLPFGGSPKRRVGANTLDFFPNDQGQVVNSNSMIAWDFDNGNQVQNFSGALVWVMMKST